MERQVDPGLDAEAIGGEAAAHREAAAAIAVGLTGGVAVDGVVVEAGEVLVEAEPAQPGPGGELAVASPPAAGGDGAGEGAIGGASPRVGVGVVDADPAAVEVVEADHPRGVEAAAVPEGEGPQLHAGELAVEAEGAAKLGVVSALAHPMASVDGGDHEAPRAAPLRSPGELGAHGAVRAGPRGEPQTGPGEAEAEVGGPCHGEVAVLGPRDAGAQGGVVDQDPGEEVQIEVALSVDVAGLVQGDALDGDGDVGPVDGVEATDEELVGLAGAAVGGGVEPREAAQQVVGGQARGGDDLLAVELALRGGRLGPLGFDHHLLLGPGRAQPPQRHHHRAPWVARQAGSSTVSWSLLWSMAAMPSELVIMSAKRRPCSMSEGR